MSSIAMVIIEEGGQSSEGGDLVSQFNKELFQLESQRKMFATTQTEISGDVVSNTDMYTGMALLYLFRKATEEVKEFNSSATIQKIGFLYLSQF